MPLHGPPPVKTLYQSPFPLSPQAVRILTTDKAEEYSEKAIRDKLNVNRLARDPAQPQSDELAKLKRLVLYLERCRSSGRLQPRVDVLHPESYTVEDKRCADSMNESFSRKRQPPPEILMATRPTEEEAIELFGLCRLQALGFRIIVRLLQARINGDTSVPQLRMAISGQAGTGKSEIMKAVVWFAFQHEMSRLIGVSAFQWKAAVLVRTPNTPAVSSCRFYGINTMNGKRNNPGHGDKCAEYFNSDVRLLWLEEAGTIGLEFIAVRRILAFPTAFPTVHLPRIFPTLVFLPLNITQQCASFPEYSPHLCIGPLNTPDTCAQFPEYSPRLCIYP